mgnify:CR=1 FL=1
MNHPPFPLSGTVEGSALGRATAYVDQYDSTLLYPIARAPQRERLGIAGQPRFFGADWWTAYELSWLNARGKPQLAIAHILVPCESTHIVESKSFKLYLNSFSGTVFADAAEVRARIEADVSAAVWAGDAVRARAAVRLIDPEAFDREPIHEMDGVNLDRLDLECTHDEPAPELLTAAFDEQPVHCRRQPDDRQPFGKRTGRSGRPVDPDDAAIGRRSERACTQVDIAKPPGDGESARPVAAGHIGKRCPPEPAPRHQQ